MCDIGGEIDPRIIDALKRKPKTDFGATHGPEIAEEVARRARPHYLGDTGLTERVVTEEAVGKLEEIIKARTDAANEEQA